MNNKADKHERDEFDVICVEHLAELIRNGKAQELVADLFSSMPRGGRLLLGSADAGPDDAGELARITDAIPDWEIAGQTVFFDEVRNMMIVEVFRVA